MVKNYLSNEVKVKEVVKSALAYVLHYLSFCNQSTEGRRRLPSYSPISVTSQPGARWVGLKYVHIQ